MNQDGMGMAGRLVTKREIILTAALVLVAMSHSAAAESRVLVLATGDVLGLPVAVKDHDDVLEKGFGATLKIAAAAGVPLHLAISGHSADLIDLGFPALRDLIGESVAAGRITVLTAPYSPPAFPLMDRWQAVYAVRRGRASLGAVWPVAGEVAGGLPLGLYDLSVPGKLGDAGIELLVGGVRLEDLPAGAFGEIPVSLMGPGDRSLAAIPSLGAALGREAPGGVGVSPGTVESVLGRLSAPEAAGLKVLEIALDTPYKRKGDKGDPESELRRLMEGLGRAGSGFQLTAELPDSGAAGERKSLLISPAADYSRFNSNQDDYDLLARIQRCLARLSDLEENRRLAELRGGQDIAMQVLLVDEARRQLSLAADVGLFGPDVPKEKRQVARDAMDSAERITRLAEALYGEGVTFEAVEIGGWNYAEGELTGGSSPLFSAPRSEFWSEIGLPHAVLSSGAVQTADWVKQHASSNWPPGLKVDRDEDQWVWYRTDKLFLPSQWDKRSVLLLFDGIAGNAYIVVNGEWNRTASHPEAWRPVESGWGEQLRGRLLTDATGILRPGRDNRLLVKIRNATGVRGIYGRVVAISPVE